MKKTVLHPLCISHRIGNCFENRVYQPLLDPHLENHPFLSLLLILPPFPLLCCHSHLSSQLFEICPPSLDTFADWLRIDRLYCVWLHVSCLSSFPLFFPPFPLISFSLTSYRPSFFLLHLFIHLFIFAFRSCA